MSNIGGIELFFIIVIAIVVAVLVLREIGRREGDAAATAEAEALFLALGCELPAL